MGKDGTELVVGANGRVFVAELEVSAPDDSSSALAAGFVDLGYVSEDGVTFSDEIEKKRVMAWNARRPIRLVPGQGTTTAAFGLLQWNAEAFRFALGGGEVKEDNGEFTYVPDPDEDDFRQLVVQWADGQKKYRLYIPRGVIQGSIELALTQTDETPLPVTFEAMPDETDDADVNDPYLFFTNDSAFEPTGSS